MERVVNYPSLRTQSSMPAARRAVDSRRDRARSGVTVMIAAHNEAAVIADTLHSVQVQTHSPDCILVVDDGSTDGTAEVAAALGVEVIRIQKNTGFKAGAMNVGLPHVTTEWLITLDADTVLAPDAVDKIVAVARAEGATSACGMVLPRRVETVWERARFVEYLLAFGVLKPVQDWYRHPMVASGCFCLYRTAAVRALGGFPTDTVGEDLDLTWRLYEAGGSVKYAAGAICYTVEPPSLAFMRKQLIRWSHGFVQNVLFHGTRILDVPMLRSFVIIASLDSLLAALVYLLLAPVLAVVHGWHYLLLVYLSDLVLLALPVLWMGCRMGRLRLTITSLPCVFILRWLNVYYFWRAVILECVLQRPLRTFEKGH